MSTDLGRGVAAVVVLAAGAGTRMKSRRSKLLHEMAGRSLLSYAVDAANAVEPDRLVVVVGHQRDQVEAHLADIAPHVTIAVQESPRGTGDAVRAGLVPIPDAVGEVVVTYGDVPLLAGDTLREAVALHRDRMDAVTILSCVVADPTGYGRIIRSDDGDQVERIVEQKDCTPEQAQVAEINSGIYVFDADVLRGGLAQLTSDNAAGELYLTDVVAYARDQGRRVEAMVLADVWQAEGVNDRVQLAAMNAELNRRILAKWQLEGVTIVDPATTWIHDSVDLASDVTILPGTHLEGATTIGEGATIGPDTTLSDVEVGPEASVVRSHCSLAVIGAGASVGPYSYLRPGTMLGERGKIGAFVESKNANIAAGAKVPHLAYCGDAEVGEGANIGAGVIFANYDGLAKNTTRVGKYSFVGSDCVLVAPVNIADGAYVAAGSVVTDDVGPGELAVARGRQRNIPGWVASRREGTKTAQAAQEALGDEGGTEA